MTCSMSVEQKTREERIFQFQFMSSYNTLITVLLLRIWCILSDLKIGFKIWQFRYSKSLEICGLVVKSIGSVAGTLVEEKKPQFEMWGFNSTWNGFHIALFCILKHYLKSGFLASEFGWNLAFVQCQTDLDITTSLLSQIKIFNAKPRVEQKVELYNFYVQGLCRNAGNPGECW